MVLLDLLGSTNPYPRIHDSFERTHGLFDYVADIEQHLMTQGCMSSSHKQRVFVPRNQDPVSGQIHISDDHVPFIQRDVPVLHWIPSPFPKVWHDLTDNVDALDLEHMSDYVSILRVLVYRYLELSIGCPDK